MQANKTLQDEINWQSELIHILHPPASGANNLADGFRTDGGPPEAAVISSWTPEAIDKPDQATKNANYAEIMSVCFKSARSLSLHVFNALFQPGHIFIP